MSLALLSPWQQLLWLVCVYAGRMAKALANAISQIAGELNKKSDEVLEKIKNGEGLNEVKKE